MKKIVSFLFLVPAFLLMCVPYNRLMSEQYEPEAENPETNRFDLQNGLICSENRNYESVIEYIKIHEGFAGGKEYICASGRRTIGYGHVIRKGESFPKQISREFADSLLRSDFSKAYAMTERFMPELQGSRKLAVAHFIYSKGIGAFLGSRLRKVMKKGGAVDAEFAKWCHYTDRHTGRKVYSRVGAKIQAWETAMWHLDDSLYAAYQNINAGEVSGLTF